MRGPWKITSQYIGDQKQYAVYRLKDTGAVDHSGNREFASPYLISREAAEFVLNEMNEVNG